LVCIVIVPVIVPVIDNIVARFITRVNTFRKFGEKSPSDPG
jgi:hypothetical protein